MILWRAFLQEHNDVLQVGFAHLVRWLLNLLGAAAVCVYAHVCMCDKALDTLDTEVVHYHPRLSGLL